MNEFILELNPDAPERLVQLGVAVRRHERMALLAHQPKDKSYVALYPMNRADLTVNVSEPDPELGLALDFMTLLEAKFSLNLATPQFYLNDAEKTIRRIATHEIVGVLCPELGVAIAASKVRGATENYEAPIITRDFSSGEYMALANMAISRQLHAPAAGAVKQLRM